MMHRCKGVARRVTRIMKLQLGDLMDLWMNFRLTLLLKKKKNVYGYHHHTCHTNEKMHVIWQLERTYQSYKTELR